MFLSINLLISCLHCIQVLKIQFHQPINLQGQKRETQARKKNNAIIFNPSCHSVFLPAAVSTEEQVTVTHRKEHVVEGRGRMSIESAGSSTQAPITVCTCQLQLKGSKDTGPQLALLCCGSPSSPSFFGQAYIGYTRHVTALLLSSELELEAVCKQ